MSKTIASKEKEPDASELGGKKMSPTTPEEEGNPKRIKLAKEAASKRKPAAAEGIRDLKEKEDTPEKEDSAKVKDAAPKTRPASARGKEQEGQKKDAEGKKAGACTCTHYIYSAVQFDFCWSS